MIIVLKSMAGVDYPLKKDNALIKTISLKGGCFLNEISDDDYKELTAQYPSFLQMIDEGFAVVSNTRDELKNNQKNVDDTLQNVVNKQDKAKGKAKNSGVDIIEGV